MFDVRGFAVTTVDQIAAEADVSPRTFFHYFASKEDVVLGDIEDRLARLAQILSGHLAEHPPPTAIRRALLEVAEDYGAEREQILLRARITLAAPAVLARSLELQTQWEDTIAASFAASFGTDVDVDPRPRVLAAATIAAMRIAQRRWLAGQGVASLPELLVETLDLIETGTGNATFAQGVPRGARAADDPPS